MGILLLFSFPGGSVSSFSFFSPALFQAVPVFSFFHWWLLSEFPFSTRLRRLEPFHIAYARIS